MLLRSKTCQDPGVLEFWYSFQQGVLLPGLGFLLALMYLVTDGPQGLILEPARLGTHHPTPVASAPCWPTGGSDVCACPTQVREHTSHLEAELEKHMAAASAECQNYAKEVAGVSAPLHGLVCPAHPSLGPP